MFEDSCSGNGDCEISECNLCTSAQCEAKCNDGDCGYRYVCNSVDEFYSEWDATLRAYNGWACNSGTVEDYVSGVNNKRNNAGRILEGSDGKKLYIKDIKFSQLGNQLELGLNSNCDLISYEIQIKRILWFDSVIRKGKVSDFSNFPLKIDLSSNSSSEDNFEIGKEYYAKLTCYKKGEGGKMIEADVENDESESIEISKIDYKSEDNLHDNRCVKAINGVIDNLRDEQENNFDKASYRASIYALNDFNIDTSVLNDILNSNVNNAIQLLKYERDYNCY